LGFFVLARFVFAGLRLILRRRLAEPPVGRRPYATTS
jgi:hypothetical protein